MREKLLAFELVENRRDAYYRERIAHHAKSEKKATAPAYDPLAAIKARMGLKY